MAKNKEKAWVRIFIISTFVGLYTVVSLISTIHVIDFFKLSNAEWLAISLAIGFEIGAAASLASIIALEKMNKSIVWVLFFVLTGMQAMGNTYYAYSHLQNFTQWSELFGLIEEDIIYQKRVLSIISGAILPLVALGFVKSLVDYIRPEEISDAYEKNQEIPKDTVESLPKEILPEGAIPSSETISALPPDSEIQSPLESPNQEVEENIGTPVINFDKFRFSNNEKKNKDSVIQTGYRAENPDDAIDLGSSEPIDNLTDEPAENKNSNWHRIFNNEMSPENLK